MALADIVQRIERESVSEAYGIVLAAERAADDLVAGAREEAERQRAHTLERSARDARTEAERIRATARLDARDRAVAEKGVLVQRVLAAARDALVAMPDDAYADLIAQRIAHAARGGERVLLGRADVSRLAGRLPEAVARVASRDLRLVWSSELADVERGVVLLGERVRSDLSIEAMVDERRDELAMLAAEMLYGEEGA